MYPTRFVLVLLTLPGLLSLALLVDEQWFGLILLVDACCLGLITGDLVVAALRRPQLSAQCRMPQVWSHNRTDTLHFDLDHGNRLAKRVVVAADLPRSFRVADEGTDRNLDLPGRKRAAFDIRVVAGERGTFRLGRLHVAVRSRLGFWRRHLILGMDHDVHVYPNLKQLHEYAEWARTDRLNLIGIRRQRRLGGDTEFERLRDYQSGDPLQRIDWKATARRDEITVRDYQISQSQTIILMIDLGRMMLSRSSDEQGQDAGNLLDLAIDASLMLAYVALAQGDRVGLIAYADTVVRSLPAKAGAAQLNRLIHAVHDLHPRPVESRHDQAFLALRRLERKRSLAVLCTHVLDDVNADSLVHHLARLHGRHLPLAILLRDDALHAPLRRPPAQVADLYQHGAAAHLINWRRAALDRLEAAGALTIDIAAEQLTAELISRYLSVKARHLL